MIKEIKAKTLELRKERSSLAPTMQFHVSEIDNIGKNKQRSTTDAETIQYVKKAVQKLKENNGNIEEIAVLESFLPVMASEEQIRQFLSTLDTSNKGAVMKAAKQQFGVLVDMKQLGQLL